MNHCEKLIFGILFAIEVLLIITYLILLIIVSAKNIKYNKFNSEDIIKERMLYEQISYEIYSSIKSSILLDLKIADYCDNDYQPLNFTVKLDPNYNFKYIITISHLFNKQLCIPIYENFKDKYDEKELKYEELLKHSFKLNSSENTNNTYNDTYLDRVCEKGYKPCGILDTMNNILCFPEKYNCPLNDIQISFNNDLSLLNDGYVETLLENNISIYLNYEENIDKPIIVSNFLSVDRPWNHEWEYLMVNKKNDKKRRYFPFDSFDIYMINSTSFNFSLKDILKWEEKYEDFISLIKWENISINFHLFYKNYIGFKNYTELKRFEKIFNKNNYKNNPLFKLSKTLRPYIASIIFALIFIFFYIFLYLYGLNKDFDSETFGFFFFVAGVITTIYFIVYTSLYFSDKRKYKKIEFEFDEQIQTVFNLYLKRIKHPIYDATIIIIFISMVPHFGLFLFMLVYGIYEFIDGICLYCKFCGIC